MTHDTDDERPAPACPIHPDPRPADAGNAGAAGAGGPSAPDPTAVAAGIGSAIAMRGVAGAPPEGGAGERPRGPGGLAAGNDQTAPSVHLEEVYASYLRHHAPTTGATAREAADHEGREARIRRPRASFPGTHLHHVDDDGCAGHVAICSRMDGRAGGPDGARRLVHIATIRHELEVLRRACRVWCERAGVQHRPSVAL